MYDFKTIEEDARKIWNKNQKEIKKAIQDNPKKKVFSFLEGPPTANAPPGLHHLEVRTLKDLICKFKFMNGFSVPRKGGWDCHGLPVEVQIEKKLGLNSKKEILSYGEEKFIKQCKESVFSNINDWNKSTEELAYWIDLENPYRTLDNDYIESVWWSLKELYKKKLLYESHKVVPFCPRCQTPLSSHEVSQGYEKVEENSVVVKFKLKDEQAYLLVWTTTPWTLPSNLAIAVNPELEYSYVNDNGWIYVIEKNLVNKFFDESNIIKTVKGKHFIGKEYEPLFDYFKDLKGAFRIIGGNFVTTEEGTGIVHMAPAFGEVDYDVCKENKIPFIKPIDENGKFTSEVPDFEGKFIKDTDSFIIARLENEDKLFKVIKYTHDYPFCWRCHNPLMYYAIKSWFIKTTSVKKKMIDLNKKINWHPEHIKDGRFGVWLDGIKDWSLSRFKFWGTPLPIWRCECGEEKIIGSVEELRKNSTKKFKEYDLHRPWIDNINFKCKCGKEMTRIPDVIDCWYDSGSATFAQFHYPFENKKEFERRFPYDFISEAIDQTRGWFYTLHAIAVMLFDDMAFKNVICAGHIVDENGEKMSKSKGNVLKPKEIIDEVGVDSVRMQFCINDPGNQKRFSVNMVKESVLPFLNVLYNCRKYYEQIEENKNSKKLEDKWILSRLNSLIKKVTEDLNNYSIDLALLSIMDFTSNDFSRTYIKMTREREDNKMIIGEVLEKIALLLAPYAPFISEYVYQLFDKNSVHLSSWPKSDSKLIDKKLEGDFEKAMKIIEIGLRERDKAQIGLKWPLASAIVWDDKKLNKELLDLIKTQLNIKEIEIKKTVSLSGEDKVNEISVQLNTKMTPELEAEGYAREISRKVQAARKNLGLIKKDHIKLAIVLDEYLKNLIEKQKDFIKERTNSEEFFIENEIPKGFETMKPIEDKIKGKEIKIFLKKV
ncbi:MAG: isoleucine--tRNA ligase [Candidatus Nanoarchaeia archaeon]|nr:isoleucine--tRNA ligase [Candidatus Nanoarchaeia archaeon]